MKLQKSPSQHGALVRLVSKLDKDAVRINREGELYIDAQWARDNNWSKAKVQATIAAIGGVMTGAATLDHLFSPFGRVVGGLIALAAGGTTAVFLGLSLKNAVDAAVWSVVLGAQRLFGRGAPLED